VYSTRLALVGPGGILLVINKYMDQTENLTTVKSLELVAARTKHQSWRKLLHWLGLVPFVGFCLAFELVPLAFMLIGSFLDTKTGSFTFDNYSRAFTSYYMRAFQNSINISLITAGIGAVIGGLCAYSALNSRWKWVSTSVTALSNVTANFAGVPLAFAFVATLGSSGLVSVFLDKSLGISIFTDNTFNLYTFYGLCFVYVYFQLPLMILLITPALRGLRKEWQEAAASLGASGWQYWRYVGLPVLFPALTASFVLLVANSLGAYATAYALAQGYINLTPIQIGFLINGNVTLDTGLANALATLLILLMAVLLLVYQRLNSRARRWVR
jgi:putative spermidine/putrescine transport system permease protein